MWTYQQNEGIIISEFSNQAVIRQTFGEFVHTQKHSVAFDINQYQHDDYVDGRVIYFNDFERDSLSSYIVKPYDESSHFYAIDKDSEPDIGQIIIMNKALKVSEEYSYMKLSFDLYINDQTNDLWNYTYAKIDYIRDGNLKRQYRLKLNNKTGKAGENSYWWGKPKEFTKVSAYFRPNSKLQDGADVILSLHRPENSPTIFIDNLELSVANR